MNVEKIKRAPKGCVTLYNGKIIKKEKAVKYNNQYMELDVDIITCVVCGNNIKKSESVYIENMQGFGCKMHTSKFLVDFGLLDTPIFAYFSTPMSSITARFNDKVAGQQTFYIQDDKKARELGFIESVFNGEYFKGYAKTDNLFMQQRQHEEFDNTKVLDFTKSRTHILTERHEYTYGIEFESATGYIPPRVWKNLDIKCVHDGSIRGGEYVTGILKGDAGIRHLQKICYHLNQRCTVDKTCGMHIHIGNANFNKEFTVYGYILAQLLEKEMFELVPQSRRAAHFCAPIKKLSFTRLVPNMKKEDYCEALEDYYSDIFINLTNQYPGNKMNKDKKHPSGRYCGQRYHWINFIPCNTVRENNHHEDEGRTLEIRSHSGTTNFIKTRNWLYLCMSFVNFIENNKSEILLANSNPDHKITVNRIIESAFPKAASSLINYFEKRKEAFEKTSESLEYRDDSKHLIESKVKSIKELVKCV